MSFLKWAHSYLHHIVVKIYSKKSDAASMLNFTSIYYWEATKFAKSVIKTKESNFRPPNLAIFFLTKYTLIHKC